MFFYLNIVLTIYVTLMGEILTMLGRIFTEFFTLVEAEFGDDMLDDIIEDAELPNEGAYTAVGNYDYLELIG